MIEENYKVYSLIDPRTEEVKYIGLTKLSLEKRLNRHFHQHYVSKKCAWIKELKSIGLRPSIELIVDGLKRDEGDLMEQQYVKMFKSIGARLTNMTNGGIGTNGYRHTEETKNEMAKLFTGKTWKVPQRNKRVSQYDINGNFIKTFASIAEAAKEVNKDSGAITHACKGRYETVRGFKWQYANN